MPINLQNILEGLTQLNPQAAQQLQARKSAKDLLQERLFNQQQSQKEFQLRQQEFAERQTQDQYERNYYGLGAADPNAASTAPGPGRRATGVPSTGAARPVNEKGAPDSMPLEDVFKGFTEGRYQVAQPGATEYPTVIRGTDTNTSVGVPGPLQTNGLPSFQAGGQTIIPSTPDQFQDIFNKGEYSKKYNETKADKQANDDVQQAQYQKALSSPEFEEFRQKNPDAAQRYVNKAMFGWDIKPEDINEALAHFVPIAGDMTQPKDVRDNARSMIQLAHPPSAAAATASLPNGGLSDAALDNAAKAFRTMGPAALANLGLGNAGVEVKRVIMNRAAELGPLDIGVQAANYRAYQATERDATVGYLAKSSNKLNVMVGHLGTLDSAISALQNNDVKALNYIANQWGVQTGDTPTTTFRTIVHRLAPEITGAYVAGGGSREDRVGNESDFDPSLGPDQLHKNVQMSVRLGVSKMKANQDQYDRGTYGLGKQRFITPENEQLMQSLDPTGTAFAAPDSSGVTNTRPPGIPPPPTSVTGPGTIPNPPSPPKNSPFQVKTPDGSTYFFDSQQQMDTFKRSAGLQ